MSSTADSRTMRQEKRIMLEGWPGGWWINRGQVPEVRGGSNIIHHRLSWNKTLVFSSSLPPWEFSLTVLSRCHPPPPPPDLPQSSSCTSSSAVLCSPCFPVLSSPPTTQLHLRNVVSSQLLQPFSLGPGPYFQPTIRTLSPAELGVHSFSCPKFSSHIHGLP